MSGRGGGGRKAPGQKPGHGGAVDAITLDVINDAKSRMQKALEATRHEFASIRTGRANPALLEQVKVDYYGALTPVNQLATITVPEPRLLVVAPWDKKMVKDVERAILKSELGLVPSSDGTVIRIPIPTLTEERRRDLVKVVRKHAEEGRVAVRNIRREAKEMIEELEESGDVSEDAAQRAMEELQKLTDELIAAVDKALEAKEKEIMEL
ncbi:MAG: ribosome recycling factor, ribosome recycling factor [Armatimonadetes bacterium CSP1-3]|nr:MAG: ribosome recycling factor, ribosome recycling factor [Armatimonadetes bacterium CSP1-3]